MSLLKSALTSSVSVSRVSFLSANLFANGHLEGPQFEDKNGNGRYRQVVQSPNRDGFHERGSDGDDEGG